MVFPGDIKNAWFNIKIRYLQLVCKCNEQNKSQHKKKWWTYHRISMLRNFAMKKKTGSLNLGGGKDFWPEYLPFHSIGPTNIDSKIYKLTLNAFSSRPRFLTKLYKTSNVIRFCNELSGPIEQKTNFECRAIFWLAYHIVWKLIEYHLHCIFWQVLV